MIEGLRGLVAEAVALGGGDLCAAGHQWEAEGGRPCPQADTPQECTNASQPVYRCTRCGQYDYGEPGGPGAEACARPCSSRHCDSFDFNPEHWLAAPSTRADNQTQTKD